MKPAGMKQPVYHLKHQPLQFFSGHYRGRPPPRYPDLLKLFPDLLQHQKSASFYNPVRHLCHTRVLQNTIQQDTVRQSQETRIPACPCQTGRTERVSGQKYLLSGQNFVADCHRKRVNLENRRSMICFPRNYYLQYACQTSTNCHGYPDSQAPRSLPGTDNYIPVLGSKYPKHCSVMPKKQVAEANDSIQCSLLPLFCHPHIPQHKVCYTGLQCHPIENACQSRSWFLCQRI